jgi:DNA-binding NarL/FixJ family response regulator
MDILIVDDHRIFREGFERALRLNKNINQVYHASNGAEALLLIDQHLPDLVFMDVQMKVMDGITATKTATKKHPTIKVIALSQFEDYYHAHKMFEGGAKGYLIKTAGIDEINNALSLVMQGEVYLAPEIKESMEVHVKRKEIVAFENILSKRELEILNSICCGKSDKKIADEFFLSARTVEWHRRNILSKTETKSIGELINLAINIGYYFP